MNRPLSALVATALAAGVLQLAPALAPASALGPTSSPPVAADPVSPSPAIGGNDRSPDRGRTLDSSRRPPISPDARAAKAGRWSPKQAAASCTPGDFGSRTGPALVSQIKASGTECMYTLFSVSGQDAYNIFREAQMVTVANAYRSNAQTYSGTNSTGTLQLVLFLRAGYYVQGGNPGTVGPYGPTLRTAIRAALDQFFANPRSGDVNDVNGETLSESIILIDSAGEQARYLYVFKRLLNGYNSSYNAFYYMTKAVNDVFTPLFRGHWNPEFVAAVTADPSIIDTLSTFALNHLDLLSTNLYYLVANAGGETTRFLREPALAAKARPLAKGLLARSAITGPTAPLWVRVAEVADAHDQAQCSYYNICNLVPRLTAASLPITHRCDAGHTIRAQAMTSTERVAACTSVINQDAYFHNIVADPGPVADDHNTNIEINAFASSKDYKTYAGMIFGIDTNNGGMYLEGDPSVVGNQARFIAYQDNFDNGFPARVWNLNHEYTHYLDGRFDAYGDFQDGQVVPDIWWIEGIAEYVSYGYRQVPNTRAITEAKKHTYRLSTLFRTTYDNSDGNRIYQWGYLATRYMLEKHRSDVTYILGRFRTGDYQGAYDYYSTTIGTRYDADFNVWLDSLSDGGGISECTDPRTDALGKNCQRSNLSAAAGQTKYFFVYLPAGVSTLRIGSAGGTGNADLYYNASTWAGPGAFSARSVNSGTTETITVDNPVSGYRFISLHATTAFSGVTVTTRY